MYLPFERGDPALTIGFPAHRLGPLFREFLFEAVYLPPLILDLFVEVSGQTVPAAKLRTYLLRDFVISFGPVFDSDGNPRRDNCRRPRRACGDDSRVRIKGHLHRTRRTGAREPRERETHDPYAV